MSELVRQAVDAMALALAESRSGEHLSDADLLTAVEQLQRLLNVTSAVQAVRIAQFAARDLVEQPDGRWESVDHGPGHVSEFVGDAFGPALGMSPIMAERKAHTAADWVAKLPQTLAAMAGGDLDQWRATVIADELVLADREVAAVVENAVYPAVLRETPGEIRRRVRRVLARTDADAVKKRAARALEDRFVRVRPGQVPGISEWWAVLPTDTSALCWAAVDALAHRSHEAGDGRSLGQARADALGELILGTATVSTTAHLLIPVHPETDDSGAALADDGTAHNPPAPERDEHSPLLGDCHVPGVGVIPAGVVEQICARFSTAVTRVLFDADTGVVRETGATHYRPPARLQEFIRLRDGTCRFPGCARAARRCDIDHVVPWPAGSTSAQNLVCLCRHHHRAKHEAGWHLEVSSDGVCTWTSRTAQQYLTQPTNHQRPDIPVVADG